MTRGRKLLFLAAVLVLLLGAAFLVNKWNPENQTEDADAVTETALFDTTAESVTRFSWTYGDETLTFDRAETGWSYEGDSRFPADADALEGLLSEVLALTAARTIDTPEDLGDYGLEEPALEITFTADATTTLLIGSETALGGQRYLCLGGEAVHLVDSSITDTFALGLYDVLELESVPEMTTLRSFTIQSPGRELHLERLENSGLAYSDQYVWFLQEEEGYLPLDNGLMEAFTPVVTGLSLDDCVDYYANEDELSLYGLDTAAAEVTILYTTTVDGQEASSIFQLEVGAATDEGCYVRLAGSDMVYLVDASLHTDLLEVTYEDLRPRDVLLMDWDTVTAVDIALEGVILSGEKTVNALTADDGTTTEETLWTLDGGECDLQAVLDSLNAMASTGLASGVTPQGEPLVDFVFHRQADSFPLVELAFFRQDDTTALVTLDGESTVLVALEDVTALIQSVNQLKTAE